MPKKPFVSLAERHPEIAAEANGWNPNDYSYSSHTNLLWKCQHNQSHIWKVSINSRTNNKSGCPYCSGNKVMKGETDLLTINPEIASEADGWDPTQYTAKSGAIKNWVCKKNESHKWNAAIKDRTTPKKSGCPFCSNKKVLIGFNDLATTHPEIAAQAYGWDATSVTYGSDKKLAWQCNNYRNHIWTTYAYHRVAGKDCPYCSNQKVLVGFNDLATTHPEIAAQALGWDPTTLTFGSHKSKKWRCSEYESHNWQAVVNNRTKLNQGCPYCSNNRVLPGFNDLATTHPEIAAQAFGWDPKKVFAGSGKIRKWQCQIDPNHKWNATSHNRALHGSNCPSCAKSGFDPNNDGYLYFLSHEDWQMLQIGITNYPENRLKSHQKLGWEVIEVRGPMDGHLTQQWESAILRMLKAKGADLANSKIAGKFDGYSEAWSQNTYQALSIKELIEATERFENNV